LYTVSPDPLFTVEHRETSAEGAVPPGKYLTLYYIRAEEDRMVQDQSIYRKSVTEEKEKDTTLFGGGFLERATKGMEDEKTIAKVAGTRPVGNPSYKK